MSSATSSETSSRTSSGSAEYRRFKAVIARGALELVTSGEQRYEDRQGDAGPVPAVKESA